MTIEEEIIKFLDGITDTCQKLRRAITHEEAPVVVAQAVVPQLSAEEEFEELKKILESDRWPEAVNSALICDPKSETDKTERGRGIIELLIDDDLKGLKFLDYGCGQGYCAHLSSSYETKVSVGYDIVKHPQWKKFPKSDAILTNDFGLVTQNGPYDVILLFDVLDHRKNESAASILEKAKNLLAPQGKIYVRCHPLTSRHGTHLYLDINKAYLHLIFTENELKQLIPQSIHAEKNTGSPYPVNEYENMFKGSGLTVVHRREIKENPEEFFKIPLIKERIMRHTGHKSYPEFQMSLSFIDVTLQKS